MPSFHVATNRGIYLIATGHVIGATDLYLGLIDAAVLPFALEAGSTLVDLAHVADLLALPGVVEPTAGWYTRKPLIGVTGTQDDVNDWTAIDAAGVPWPAASAGSTICACFVAREVGSDAQDDLISVATFDPPVPTDGSTLSALIADLFHLVAA